MKLIIGTAVVAALAAACGTKEYAVGTATVTGATNVTRAAAIDRITTERCNRELSCGNIGPNRLWADMASCRADVHEDSRNYLHAENCGGVDFYDLAVCTDAIRNTQCMGDGQPHLAACDGAKLCR